MCSVFLGGVPNTVVPDNLKSGVTAAHRYDPDLNPTYQDMATHYGVAILPARVRKPRDKAKVEVGVQIVERTILAALRHRQFFSRAELNSAIAELLTRLNQRSFKKLPGSRQSQFEAIDQPVLKPLPATAYEYAEWEKGPRSTSIITSRSSDITAPCRTASSNDSSTCASPLTPSSASTKVSAWPAIDGLINPGGTRRCLNTCRRNTATMRSSHPSDCNAGPPTSAPTPRRSLPTS